MEEVKYIPGDLVMTDGCPIGTKKGVAYIVVASDPSSTITLDNGTIIKSAVTLDAVTEEEKCYFVKTSTWIKHIAPIPLNPTILEANGWKIDPSENVTWYKYRTDKANLYICRDSFTNKDWLVCVGLYKLHIANIKHVHQLQHLLFGLGLDSSLKV